MNAMMRMAQQENKAAKAHWDKGRNIDVDIKAEVTRVLGLMDTGPIWDIVNAAVESSDVTVDEILSPTRSKTVVRVRQYCMWKSRQFGYSLPQISAFFDRDHSTVMHGCAVISKILEDGESL